MKEQSTVITDIRFDSNTTIKLSNELSNSILFINLNKNKLFNYKN